MELILAVAILAIVVSAASGLIKEQAKLSSSINIKQNLFNEARVAMQFITRETSVTGELRIVPLESEPHGIVSWDTLDDVEIDKLVSDTFDSGYKLYYDNASNKLFNKTGNVVAENITKLDIKRIPPESFKLSDSNFGSTDDKIVNNVYQIEIQAGTGNDSCVLKSYIWAK